MIVSENILLCVFINLQKFILKSATFAGEYKLPPPLEAVCLTMTVTSLVTLTTKEIDSNASALLSYSTEKAGEKK